MEAYELYRNDKLLVNRRYQRKLVWSISEKQKLIESILNRYPIPLILLAAKGSTEFEILDGMQRLNAFFGFIENQFPVVVNGFEKYFNVRDYTFAETQANKGIFQKISSEGNDFIAQEEVSRFISYPFPVTIFKAVNDEDINETFRRINANGKHLSPQEVRQAGNVSKFALLVRDIAAEIRGDSSSEVLLLSKMPEISIDSKLSGLGYGVNAEDTFWCKHGILRVSNLRDSEDEQLISDIILSIALGAPFPAIKKEFDNYYGIGEEDKSQEIEIKLNSLDPDNIKNDINLVFSEIMNFADNYLEGGKLRDLLNPSARGNPVKEPFYIFFMTVYELIIKENKEVFDYAGLKNSLSNIREKLGKSRNYITEKDRIANIKVCKGLIQDCFKEASRTFRSPSSYIVDFQTYLTRSKLESPFYDFKQGLYSLNPAGRVFNETSFEEKIIMNIAALANLGKGKKGFLFIGVTDKEADTKKVEQLDSLTNVPRFHGFGIVGLEREAMIRSVTLDEYVSFISEKISNSELPEDLKRRIGASITTITYHGKTVLMIEVECGNQPVYYKDKMYIRDGSSKKEITGAKQAEVFGLFR